MDQNETERVARRFHDIYEQLAPSFGWKTQEQSAVAWSELPDENRKLMIATVGVIMQELSQEKLDAQQLEFDRNHWQRKIGVLLRLTTDHAKTSSPSGQLCSDLHEAAVRAVNTNWYTGSQGDPIADIAQLTIEHTIKTAIAAGLVQRVTNGDG